MAELDATLAPASLLFRVAATFTAEPLKEYLRTWYGPLKLEALEAYRAKPLPGDHAAPLER